MTAADKLKAIIKMTDKELHDYATTISRRVETIPPTEDREVLIDRILDEAHTMFDGEMDVRNAFNPPINYIELYNLVADWFVEMGYLKHPPQFHHRRV